MATAVYDMSRLEDGIESMKSHSQYFMEQKRKREAARQRAAAEKPAEKPEEQRVPTYEEMVQAHQNANIRLKDLNKGAILGTGNFGTVYLVTPKKAVGGFAPQVYALKRVEKAKIVDNDQITRLHREKELMYKLGSHPFIIKLYNTWSEMDSIYYLMEYAPGGELFRILHLRHRLSLATTRTAAAQIACALAFLHENNVVYRDLKPENIMINAHGHLRLIDFGMAKAIDFKKERMSTICGTAEYLAPEMLTDPNGYDKGVDWWTLGVLMYEMTHGYSPFAHKDGQDATFRNIVLSRLTFASAIKSTRYRDLVSRLLEKDPKKRLGNLAGGSGDVLQHAFFDGIDWAELKAQTGPGPFVPDLQHLLDTSSFVVQAEEDLEPVEEYTTELQAKFEHFFAEF